MPYRERASGDGKAVVETDITTAPAVRGEIDPATIDEIVRANGEPVWFAERRRQAWEVYRETPMPTTKDEAWRYTDLAKIPWQDLRMRDPAAPKPVARREDVPAEILQAVPDQGDVAGTSIEYNGVQLWREMAPELERQGVLFLDLATAIREHPQLVQTYFMTSAVTPGFGKLAALHGAFVSGGTVIYVPEGVEIELPITSFRWLDLEGAAVFPHTLLIAGPYSKVTYVEECASPSMAIEGLAM